MEQVAGAGLALRGRLGAHDRRKLGVCQGAGLKELDQGVRIYRIVGGERLRWVCHGAIMGPWRVQVKKTS